MTATRLHAFDALRAGSILFIFLWHAGLAFADPPLRFWPVTDPAATWGFSLPLWFSRGFRLATFFVMSGFFGRLSLVRSTPGGWVGQRLLRIGVPLVATLLLYNLLLPHAPGQIDRWAPKSGLWPPGGMRPLHLWFLEHLLVISGVVLALTWALPRVLPASWPDRGRRAFGALLGRAWAPLLMVPVTAPILWWQRGQYPRTSPADLAVEPDTLVYFGVFFAFGWLLHARADVLSSLCRHAWSWVVAGVVVRALTLFPLLPGVSPASLADGSATWGPSTHYLDRTLDLPPADLALVVLGAEVYAWLMVFGLMGVFLRLFRREIPWLRWFADGSYWLYLVHMIPVLLLQEWLGRLAPAATSPAAAVLRFAGVVLGSLAAVLISYRYLVRHTAVGRLLHGPRARPRDRMSGG